MVALQSAHRLLPTSLEEVFEPLVEGLEGLGAPLGEEMPHFNPTHRVGVGFAPGGATHSRWSSVPSARRSGVW